MANISLNQGCPVAGGTVNICTELNTISTGVCSVGDMSVVIASDGSCKTVPIKNGLAFYDFFCYEVSPGVCAEGREYRELDCDGALTATAILYDENDVIITSFTACDSCGGGGAGTVSSVTRSIGTTSVGGNEIIHDDGTGNTFTFCESFDSVREEGPCDLAHGGLAGVDVNKMIRDVYMVNKELVIDAAAEHTSASTGSAGFVGQAVIMTTAGHITPTHSLVFNNPSICRTFATTVFDYATVNAFTNIAPLGVYVGRTLELNTNGGGFVNVASNFQSVISSGWHNSVQLRDSIPGSLAPGATNTYETRVLFTDSAGGARAGNVSYSIDVIGSTV